MSKRATRNSNKAETTVTDMGEEVPKDIPGLFLYLKKRFDTLEEDQSVKFNEINEKLKVVDSRLEANETRMVEENDAMRERIKVLEEKQVENNVLQGKVADLENKLLFAELKSKKQNVIILNMPQSDVREKADVSMKHVETFLYSILRIDTRITILEAHRLRRKNKTKTGPLPLIFKLLHVGDKQVMKDKLSNLTVFNSKNDKSDAVFVEFDHLPVKFKEDKDTLKDDFYHEKQLVINQ